MDNKSLRSKVSEMKIGEAMTISVEDYGYNTIRNYASDLGFSLNRVYRATRNRATRTYTITRLA